MKHIIVVDKVKNIELKNEEIVLDTNNSILELNILGSGKIYSLNNIKNNCLDLTINLNDNSNLELNFFNSNLTNVKVKINQGVNSKLIFNWSFLVTKPLIVNLNSQLNKDNNLTSINYKAITIKSGSCQILANGIIKEKTKDNEFSENIKCLNLNNAHNEVIPNLVVKTSDAYVNHSASIAMPDLNVLNYLMSKGINKTNAINLISSGFLIQNLNIGKDDVDYLKNIIES